MAKGGRPGKHGTVGKKTTMPKKLRTVAKDKARPRGPAAGRQSKY